MTPSAPFSVTVNGGSTATDWIATYTPAAPNAPAPMDWQYVPLPRPTTRTVTAPSGAGTYEVRLFANNTFAFIGSCTFQVN